MLACCFAAAMAVFSATAGNEPHRKGEFALTFTETDPRGEMKEMLRRKFPELEINDKGIDKDTGYAVDSRTFEAVVPESYDPKVPAPLFVWVGAKYMSAWTGPRIQEEIQTGKLVASSGRVVRFQH